MSQYKNVLNEWAMGMIPNSLSPVSIVDVSFSFEKGYGGGCDTCGYGADEDKMSIWIEYNRGDGSLGRHETTQEMYYFESGMGDILRQLFKIAEEEDVDS